MDHVQTVNGEQCVSPVGVILMALHGWRVERKEPCREALRRYCEYLAMRNYGKGSKAIYSALACMPDRQAEQWIETTFKRYIADPVAAVEYVLGTAVQRP